MGSNHFIIVSNGRAGTTFLATSLNELPGVELDYELKWKPHYEPHPIHVLMNEDGWQSQAFFDSISQTADAVGSRLVFEAELCLAPEDAEEIVRSVESSVRIIHLTRNYFDIVLSLQARGAINVFNRPINSLKGSSSVMLETIERETKRFESTDEAMTREPTFDLEGLKSMALNLFQNDLIGRALCDQADHSMRLDYTEISGKLGEVARFIGFEKDTALIKEIVGNPVTRKLPKLDPDVLPDSEKLRSFCDVLYNKMQFIAEFELPYTDVWQKDGQIKLPGFGI